MTTQLVPSPSQVLKAIAFIYFVTDKKKLSLTFKLKTASRDHKVGIAKWKIDFSKFVGKTELANTVLKIGEKEPQLTVCIFLRLCDKLSSILSTLQHFLEKGRYQRSYRLHKRLLGKHLEFPKRRRDFPRDYWEPSKEMVGKKLYLMHLPRGTMEV
jgi:hypothetical protein